MTDEKTEKKEEDLEKEIKTTEKESVSNEKTEKKEEDLEKEIKTTEKESVSNEKTEKKEEKVKKSEKKSFKINKADIWKYTTFILLGILLILGIVSISKGGFFTGQVILNEDEIGDKLVTFLGELVPGGQFTIIDSEDLGYIYEFTVNYEGDVFPLYITKDGEYFIPDLIPTSTSLEFNPDQNNNPDSSTMYSEEEVALLTEFNECLADKGTVIYGSATCPYCAQLVELLGGHEAVSSIYVECESNYERCTQEMQGQGVPEIQFNGILHTGQRTLEIFSEATGCPLPF
ncbi:hypothetical protein K0A97_01360 [Patescibacteria group bacterium]|nr:hypothetical protein [Patescibacteria group bacterium]